MVISNFVVHEMKDRSAREEMMREIARVLRSGGRVALVDFIFTDDSRERPVPAWRAGVCEMDCFRFGFPQF